MAVCVTDSNIDPGSVTDVFRQFHFQVLRLTRRRNAEPPAQAFGQQGTQLQTKPKFEIADSGVKVKVQVKQFHYRSEQAQRVPGS